MVIGKTFAWAHLPKAGGDATAAMFRLFPDLVEFQDPVDSDAKHPSFQDRAGLVAGKRLVLNIRRLPAWVLSRAHHVNREGLAPDYEPLPMDSPHELSESSFPDYRLGTFTDDGRLEIGAWLRMESLAEDFLRFVSELRDVTEEERARVGELGANRTPLDLPARRPAARFAASAPPGLVRSEHRGELAFLLRAKARGVADHPYLARLVVQSEDERAERALLLAGTPPDDHAVDRADTLDFDHPRPLTRPVGRRQLLCDHALGPAKPGP